MDVKRFLCRYSDAPSNATFLHKRLYGGQDVCDSFVHNTEEIRKLVPFENVHNIVTDIAIDFNGEFNQTNPVAYFTSEANVFGVVSGRRYLHPQRWYDGHVKRIEIGQNKKILIKRF